MDGWMDGWVGGEKHSELTGWVGGWVGYFSPEGEGLKSKVELPFIQVGRWVGGLVT